MSTTKKAEKEVAADVAAMESAISSLSYEKIAEILHTKKEQALKVLHEKLAGAHELVTSLTNEIRKHGGEAAPKKHKYTRKAKAVKKATAKPAKAPKKGKKTYGAVGVAITKVLTEAGTKGAHVKDIAKATGFKKENINSYFFGGAGKKAAKKIAPATFALRK